MKLEGSTLVYLNAVLGTVFIMLAVPRYGTIWVAALFLSFAVLFLVGAYASERYLLRRLGEGRPIGTRGVQEADRFAGGGSLMLNVVALVLLWIPFLPPQSGDTVGVVTTGFWITFFFWILARDFTKLGEELARRGHWRRVSSEPWKEPE